MKKGIELNTSTRSSSHYFFIFKKREMVLIYLATIHTKLNFQIINIFGKRADTSIPGLRGLFLFYHRFIQASIENNDLNYIIPLSTYSLWNDSKCFIGNILYFPEKTLSST